MKVLRFLWVGSLWFLCLLLVAFFLFFDPSDEWVHQWANLGELVSNLSSLFRFSDHWNCIAITFLASISVIILCLNDLLITRICSRLITFDRLSFWAGGLFWVAKSISNTAIFLAELVCLCYLISMSYASPYIVRHTDLSKGHYTVLLLGTSKYLKGTHQVNRYYAERLNSCYHLYKKGLIGELIISGDGASSMYDETVDMYTDLLRMGLRGVTVVLDPKGYRTFDSIKRIKGRSLRNGRTEVLIVSQYFHLQRALYLAKSENITARGVLAEGSLTFKMFERELFAKTRVLLDIYIFNTQTSGIYTQSRRLVDPSSYADICLLAFVLSSVAIAGRMTKILLYH